ncbi:MAG: Hpt domain-containing protein [Desulfosalsimonas sp.]
MAGKEKDYGMVFDKKDFFDRIEGDLELARQLGEMFLDDARETIGLIRDRIGKKDTDGIMRAAHSLKGASANLSAIRLQRISADLEKAAKENRLYAAGEIFSLLENEVANFTAELKRHILG